MKANKCRNIMIWIPWILCSMILSGCQQCQSKKSSVSAQKTLNLAWSSAPKSLDPRYGADANSFYLEDLVHCSLINFDQNGSVVGKLANSWEWSTDTTLKVKLRDKTYFSNGNQVTADDVVATYGFFKLTNLKKPSRRSGAFTKIKEVKKVDPLTVQFILSEADASFITNLVVGILPADQAQNESLGYKDLVGCGPYTMAAKKISSLHLKKNEKYSFDPKPSLREIVIHYVKDESTRLSKLRNGELDLVQNEISLDQIKVIEGDPNLVIQKKPGLNTVFLGYNFRDKLIADKRTRQALQQAIDKKKLIQHILKGFAEPANSLILDGSEYYSNSLTVPHDLASAKAAVAKLKLEGFNTKLKITTSNNQTQIILGKAIAKQFQDAGFETKVESLEWGKYMEDVKSGLAQIWIGRWVGYKDPDILRYVFSSTMIPPNGGNRGHYTNKELDTLLEDAAKHTSKELRVADYKKAQKIIEKDMPYLHLWHQSNYVVHRKNIKGFELFADGRYSSLVSTTKQP